MKVTTKGQVTIPARIRGFFGVAPHGDVDFQIVGGNVVLIRLQAAQGPDNQIESLRGVLKGKLTTQQWMQATRGD